MEEKRGTIKTKPKADYEFAAQCLKKSLCGMGTDEKCIIQVLTTYDNLQREEIKKKYKAMYGRDLIKDLKNELGGHFETTVVTLLTSRYDIIVRAIHGALSKSSSDAEMLTELLSHRNNEEVEGLAWWYGHRYKKSLDDALSSKLSGDFKRMMRSLVSSGRDESDTLDEELAKKDAHCLRDAGIGYNAGTDEGEFIRILNQRNFSQLQKTFTEYDDIADESIEESIEKEFSGKIKTGLLAIVSSVRDRPTFFAQRLFNSIDGIGTDDATLIRIIVCRSEIDLMDIKSKYEEMFGKSLSEAIKDDTSGDYAKLLLAILDPRVEV